MVLCGIGGRTIAEAQQRLSYPEFMSWVRYRRKRGSFHTGMRVEEGAAQLAALYANSKSSKTRFNPWDFGPHMDEPPLSLEQAMKTWQ